jgi:hypothetical protein
VKDGNKESTKEMLAAFRIISSADLSIILVLATAKTRAPNDISNWVVFLPGAAFSLSLAFCVHLFLLSIRRLSNETPAIIDLPEIKGTAIKSLVTFLLGILLLVTTLTVI